MKYLPQNVAGYAIVKVVDSTDRITPKTTLVHADFTASLSKGGGAFATISPTANITHLADGEYIVWLSATHLNTAGFALLRLTATNSIGIEKLLIGGKLDEVHSRLQIMESSNVTQFQTIQAAIEEQTAAMSSLSGAVGGAQQVVLVSPYRGETLEIVRGASYDGVQGMPLIEFPFASNVSPIGNTATLTVKNIETGQIVGSAPTTNNITFVAGTTYNVNLALTTAHTTSWPANKTLARRSITDVIDGWENLMRWDIDMNMAFDLVIISGSSRKFVAGGAFIVQENITQ